MKCIVCGNDIPDAVNNCPVCGAAAPTNAPSYGSYGNEPVYTQPVQQPYQQQPVQQNYQQPFQNPYQSAAYAQPAVQQPVYEQPGSQAQQPAFRSADDYDPYAGVRPVSGQSGSEADGGSGRSNISKGMIVGIAAGAVVIIGLIICFALGLFHFRNGTYIWDDYEFDGTSLMLEISGDEGVLTAKYNGKTDTENIHLDFDGSKVVLSANGKYIEGTYNRKNQTISIPDDSLQGFEVVLKKK